MPTEIIKSARASLLLPSRPKTPMDSKSTSGKLRLKTLRPLGATIISNLDGMEHNEIENFLETGSLPAKISIILKLLKRSKHYTKIIEKAWNVLAKISAMDQVEEEILNLGGLDLIMQNISQNISMDKLKTLKNLSFSIDNHKALVKHGIFEILDHELSKLREQRLEIVIITTEIYRNLASNPQNSKYFLNFFSTIERNDPASMEVWFNVLRICAKLSLEMFYNEFWITKFKILLVDNLEFRVSIFELK